MLLLLLEKTRASTWDSIAASLSSPDFWFKVFVLLVCAPIWFPILRAIYRELDRSLRPEGGVFAREYSPREAKLIEEREGRFETSLKSVPRADPLGRSRRAQPPGGARTARGADAGDHGGGRSGGITGRSLRGSRGAGFQAARRRL